MSNIHRLTGPLFYDALKDELTAIEGLKTEKERKFKLNAFRAKIASLKFLDPACGSGNFLTETYLSLRKLENRVLEDIYGGQMVMGDFDPIQVSLDQFYGIEINDFAVEVAKTALWIAELQMLDQTREILSMWIDPLPLKSNDNIVCANALQTDWNEILPASECDYVIGNPPFIGHQWRTKEQQADMDLVFDGWAKYGKLDYVCAWYKKFSDYAADCELSGAFVSTNSICQGESVPILWDQLFALGVRIIFAYQTFIWNSEAIDQAHVHCVIVGFSKNAPAPKRLTIFNGDAAYPAKNINGYLVDGPSLSVQSRKGNLNPSAPPMSKGSQPTDGGNLILEKAEADEFKARNPDVADLVKPFMGAREFLNGEPRYCLYLKGVPRERYIANGDVSSRLDAISQLRSQSPTKSVRDFAGKPELFTQDRQPTTNYLVMPKTTSGRRYYVPIGFMGPEVIVSDKLHIVPDADLYLFGLLESLMHQCWIRTVSGRLKSDYEYAPAVYNSFIWPNPTDEQREEIERCARAVLDAREAHPDRTLAEMYDGISPMPENPSKADQKKYAQREYDDLKAAHAALDAAVEVAYGVDFDGDEEKIVAHLFKLYAEATQGE